MNSDRVSKTYLLVTGVARSGTTALSELLNSHSQICLGVERFKFQFLRANVYDRQLFERSRFFSFLPEDTNLDPAKRPAWKPTYDAIAEKWDSARVVGDKVPDMMPVLPDFMAENPDFRYICTLRNLKDVALSWQTRADRPRDSWPRGKGFETACASWQEQHQQLSRIMRNKRLRKNVMLLDYDQIYLEPEKTEAAILGFLELEKEPEFTEILAGHSEFFAGRSTRRVPKRFLEAYRAVDHSYARGLRKIARQQMSEWGNVSSDIPLE